VEYGTQDGLLNTWRQWRLEQYRSFTSWMHGSETQVKFAAAFSLAILTALLAQVSFITPLSPVPYTLQVLGIAFMGGFLGSRWALASASMYLAMGLIGLPVFAGQMQTFQTFEAFSGVALFTTSLSAWYLVGFVAQAYIIGLVADRRADDRPAPVLAVAGFAVVGLILLALVDVYYLANYSAMYKTSQFPSVWFLLLSAGLVVILTAVAFLSMTTKARRERVELFLGNVAGLVVLYAIGAAGLYNVWGLLGYGALDLHGLMQWAVLPFIPGDLLKILIAVGVLTMLRPTAQEIEGAKPNDVNSGPTTKESA
jgi:biotin transporter BioY